MEFQKSAHSVCLLKKEMKHIINAAPGLAEHSRVEANCDLVDLRDFDLTHS